ncbi:hypothetical protein [Halarcobacter ebronensis]|uniref:Uncharacterized protein n=1 Tax=Halarcobacter ebronensis TaxID=1462615 RepID=A0A4Q1AXF2_9BACT|nr:hypothetical protein [Halarcobacter ebronensis]QKF82411.1 putative membrane protein [Halarcobacter ebronensis]RXK07566.1 hypothetical protein CRV07_03645 [Halarcobacter ebronensis]
MDFKKYKIRVNKYPYLLWLGYTTDINLDFKNKKAVSEVAESKFKKVDLWKVLLMKYGVFVFIIFGLFIYPKELLDFKIFGASLISVAIGGFVLIKFPKYFIKFLVLLLVGGFLVFYNYIQIGVYVESYVMYASQIIIVAILIRDIVKKKYENYYYLKDIKKVNQVNLTKQHNRPLIPLLPRVDSFGWQGKGLFRVKRGFNFGFNFSVGGYFMRIENEVK